MIVSPAIRFTAANSRTNLSTKLTTLNTKVEIYEQYIRFKCLFSITTLFIILPKAF